MTDRVRSLRTGLGSGSNLGNGSNSALATPILDALIPVVREKRLQKILRSIELRVPHSVRELAKDVQLTPAHLQRLFKHETGAHIRDVLCEHRLTVASKLLITTNLGIKEVADIVGYGHHSSFVRAFHRRFGQAPKTFRRNSGA